MKVNWYNGLLYVLFSFIGIYDLTQGNYSGCIIWMSSSVLNLALIIIIHLTEIHDKLENIEKKLENKYSAVDPKGKMIE